MKPSKLKVLRFMRGWGLMEVAAKVGCHFDTLRKVENRLLVCPQKWQEPLAALYGLRREDLFDPGSGLAAPWGDDPHA